MSSIPVRCSAKVERPLARADGGLVQSLSRALLLLETLSGNENGYRLRDLCRKTGLSPSTAHRLLTTMEQKRFVSFDPDDLLWQVGSKCLTIGAVFMRKRKFLSGAMQQMQHLSVRLGETVSLGVAADDASVLLLKQAFVRQFRSDFTPVGAPIPGHSSAMGKVLLAARKQAEREALLRSRKFCRLTTNTIVEPSLLSQELDLVAAQGYAIDNEESLAGRRCVAAPLFNEVGECIAAVSVSAGKTRLSDNVLPQITNALALAASEMTAACGGFVPERLRF